MYLKFHKNWTGVFFFGSLNLAKNSYKFFSIGNRFSYLTISFLNNTLVFNKQTKYLYVQFKYYTNCFDQFYLINVERIVKSKFYVFFSVMAFRHNNN